MALSKEIELESGVKVNYHRILNINTFINNTIQIIVASYVSDIKRQDNLIITTEMIIKEYEEEFDVRKAYEYLKTLDKYKNAENC